MRRRRAAAVAAVGVAVGLAGCGTTTEDLIAVDVSGGLARVHEHIRVTNDGRASCGGELRQIPSQMLLDAREVKRDLRPLARRGASFPPSRAGTRRYVFRSFDGTVRFAEGAPGPPALARAALITLRLERGLCRG
jgi:hypothetical protein